MLAIGHPAISQVSPPPQRFRAVSQGLADSTIESPLIRARAAGHLASMADDPAEITAGLRACSDERSRLAYLDAALAGGARSFDRARAESQALEMLMAMAPDDRASRIQRELRRLEDEPGNGPIDWGSMTSDDMVWRPFTWSPETPADRLARLSPAMRKTLLDLEEPGPRPKIIAAVLAAIPDEAVEERDQIILDLDVDEIEVGPAVMQELAYRRATNVMIEMTRKQPIVISVPTMRVATAAAIARDQPEAAIQILGGEANILQLPGHAVAGLRRNLAEGHRHDADPELWKIEIAQIGQTDDRLEAMLALETMHPEGADPQETDPERTFEEIQSMRTLTSGRVVSGIERGFIDRDDAIQALENLFRTGRYDLAFTFLTPNTTEPTRSADQWLPVRIGLLSEALADADAAPDAWIPLIESLQRLDRLDGQIAALRAIQEGYGRMHGDQELPEDLRLTLDNALIEIAVD